MTATDVGGLCCGGARLCAARLRTPDDTFPLADDEGHDQQPYENSDSRPPVAWQQQAEALILPNAAILPQILLIPRRTLLAPDILIEAGGAPQLAQPRTSHNMPAWRSYHTWISIPLT
ncbi:hypothetical protein V494_03451 [Pseudogymnoascus sp. VKM F-4513 (FW-928)]|nr:hypothetical protein V494_03451 [Pseudogymnoascus sp. VKM F-4513 (FW-928)]